MSRPCTCTDVRVCVQALRAAPSPTSADYLLERTTRAVRGRMRVRPEASPDVAHDDLAYRQLRRDVPPLTAHLPPAYYRHQVAARDPLGRQLGGAEGEGEGESRDGGESGGERRSSVSEVSGTEVNWGQDIRGQTNK